MKNRIVLIVFGLLFVSLLSGCKDNFGVGFLGNWHELTNNKYPAKVDIIYKDGVFYIDESRVYPGSPVKGQYSIEHLEAKADSESVLLGKGFSMNLEKRYLHYKGDVFVKK